MSIILGTPISAEETAEILRDWTKIYELCTDLNQSKAKLAQSKAELAQSQSEIAQSQSEIDELHKKTADVRIQQSQGRAAMGECQEKIDASTKKLGHLKGSLGIAGETLKKKEGDLVISQASLLAKQEKRAKIEAQLALLRAAKASGTP